MTEILSFLLASFIIICVARPIAKILRIPVFTVYTLSGIFLGPSGIRIIPEPSTLNPVYEIGIILLMFSAGLELKLHILRKHRKSLSLVYILDALVPGIAGFFLGVFLHRYFGIGDPLFLPLFMFTLFSASAVEVLIPLFREFSARTSVKLKTFYGVLLAASVLANATSLFVFSGTITYNAVKTLSNLVTLAIFSAAFVFVVLKGLPFIQEKILRYAFGPLVSSEDETRILIVLLIVVIGAGAAFHIHPMVCAFLAGISLANVHIGRRVLHNIDFITSGIFMPFVFIVVGMQIDLSLLHQKNYILYPVLLITAMVVVRTLSIYIASRISGISQRDSLGFGLGFVSQMTGTIATAVVAHRAGILPEPLFYSVIILSIVTTIIGPVGARNLLFPGIRTRGREFLAAEDFTHYDIRPIPLLGSFSSILQRARDTELSIYPVVDENGIYQGVVHLEDVKNLVFAEELDNIVIAADLLDREYPSVARDMPVDETLEIFRRPGTYAVAVVEESEEGKIYIGMLLLRDMLPQSIKNL